MSSKITEMKRRSDRDWQHSSGGTMFVFEITTDDGTHGFANAKSETPWYAVGTNVIARVRSTNHGESMLKIEKPEFENAPPSAMQPNTNFVNQGSGHQRNVDASIAASWAIDHAMKMPMANVTIDTIREGAKQLMDLHHELKVHHKEKYP